jgi:hypothetical protein
MGLEILDYCDNGTIEICRTRGIILKAIFLEIIPLYNLENVQKLVMDNCTK